MCHASDPIDANLKQKAQANVISGTTKLIAHIGYPTTSFKAPMIYNPYFEKYDIDAVVMPMGCGAADFETFLPQVSRLSNFLGALITMPHKVATVELMDEITTTAAVAGSCNAVRRSKDGRLIGDMFDGEGFVRGLKRRGRRVAGATALVIGCGGVGSAIAASLANSGVACLGLTDINHPTIAALAGRLDRHYPKTELVPGAQALDGWDIIVNATPLGMNDGDPLPMDISGIAPSTFVGEVVMARDITPFLAVARARGCDTQIGLDMLFEQIPAYLEFFGLRTANADELRSVAAVGRGSDVAGDEKNR